MFSRFTSFISEMTTMTFFGNIVWFNTLLIDLIKGSPPLIDGMIVVILLILSIILNNDIYKISLRRASENNLGSTGLINSLL